MKIKWENRYSDTMEPDKFGRWARIAYVGDFENPVKEGKKALWDIAWISQINNRFTVSYSYPQSSPHNFASLEEAKAEVERSFEFFIDTVNK